MSEKEIGGKSKNKMGAFQKATSGEEQEEEEERKRVGETDYEKKSKWRSKKE